MGDLHAEVLERAAALARERAAEKARQADDCARRVTEGLNKLEDEESW
jgi:hypothetical protein